MTEIPKDLELKALETTNVPVAVVCPDQESILLAIKKGHEIVRVFFYHDGINNANKF